MSTKLSDTEFLRAIKESHKILDRVNEILSTTPCQCYSEQDKRLCLKKGKCTKIEAHTNA